MKSCARNHQTQGSDSLGPVSPAQLLLEQHALYRALKAFGQVPKSLFILQVTDDPVLRQAIEKQMDRIEHVHRFTRAVSVGNPREFL